MSPAARHVCALLVLTVAAVETLSAQGTLMQPVSTVTDAVFRSQWVGPQADRPELLGLVPTGEGIKPVEATEPDFEKLRVALAIYSASGDLEIAWKAASRLVTARKNGQ